MEVEQLTIEVQGARAHNLKNLDISIPREQLVVITGLSGSGKSSLAFDTIYAEGQRRYIDTFSAYARQFLGSLERPDVDKIDGLSPVIAIEQKTTSRSPRSTVGTTTEIYDFLRLLYARASDAYSMATGALMVQYSTQQMLDQLIERNKGQKIQILAPLIRGRKGHYRELFDQMAKKGFLKVRVDGVLVDLSPGMKLDRYKVHDIELVVDRLEVNDSDTCQTRLLGSLSTALEMGGGSLIVLAQDNPKPQFFSNQLMCPDTGMAYMPPEPNTFSFNSPKGMCPDCKGLGTQHKVVEHLIFPNPNWSIAQGGIAPLGAFKNNWTFKQLAAIGLKCGFDLDTPIEKLSVEAMEMIRFGAKTTVVEPASSLGINRTYDIDFEGIDRFIQLQYDQAPTASLKRWAAGYMEEVLCATCAGTRLQAEALQFKIAGKNIAELSSLDLAELIEVIDQWQEQLRGDQRLIAHEVIKEIKARIRFLLDVGLHYLTLDRSAATLSGGESQRIRLATQIGAQLVGVLYILDEPSIGLHQRDNIRLINSLIALRDLGNSVLVVEHDKDMILAADHVIDMGPKAGVHGGRIVWQGAPQDLPGAQTMTADYLTGKRKVVEKRPYRSGNGWEIKLTGCRGHNLKNIDVTFPLGILLGISGVSGSGKSSLINETLYPILNNHFFNGVMTPLPYDSIEGLAHLDKVIEVDQSPIGRTPRSNPVTYTGVFDDIRQLFSKTTEAQIRGYQPGRFSFNVKSGRCETCEGGGYRAIEMNFLPDVYVLCESCQGKRFNRETLDIRFKGKSIADVLEMTIDQGVQFFESIPKIYRVLKTLQEVGLGYIQLGQSSTTLSGGEAQRVKLATELSKKATGKTMYILDEPTTGLHFEDISVLLGVLQKLVDKGNTVVVIEHNLDVLMACDHLIDIGPEAGRFGGTITAHGTPEEVANHPQSHTGIYLKKEFNL